MDSLGAIHILDIFEKNTASLNKIERDQEIQMFIDTWTW